MAKQIKLTYSCWDRPEIVKSSADLEELYRVFLSQMIEREKSTGKKDKEIETVENIHKNYEDVWKNIEEGTYSLEDFEERALRVIA